MARSNKAKSVAFLRWFLLLPIPVVWGVLEDRGLLTFMENRSVDWRFRWRGELASPVKLVYFDVDSMSQNRIGNHPWTRDTYTKVAAALVKESKVKAIGFDFVFSDRQGIAQSADRRRIARTNVEFGRFLDLAPPVALAASYAGWQYVDIERKIRERQLPLLSKNPKPGEITPPEIPYFQVSSDPQKDRFHTPPITVGLIDTIDAGTRLVPAWAPSDDEPYYHMAVELARLYWGLPPEALRVREGNLEFVNSDGLVRRSLPLIDGQLLEINWFTKWTAAGDGPHVPGVPLHVEFVDVLDLALQLESKNPAEVQQAKEFFSSPELRDAVVLVGPVDALLQDRAPTSLNDDPVPKVSVHGNLLRTIVSGLTLRRPQPGQIQFIIFGLTAIIVTLSVVSGRRAKLAWVMKGLAAFALLLYAAATFWSFQQAHWVLPLVAPLGAALSASFGGLIIQFIDAQKAKARVTGMFGTYLSPQLVKRMVESHKDPELGGNEAEITAYFSDIQSFSKFSEILGPKKLVELMNEYLTACTDILTAQEGTLDKYIGDAVVAMYGAPVPLPDHAYRACVTTQLVQQKLGELRVKWKSEVDKGWPEIVWNMQTRIGLNTGECTIGNMGSASRFCYTMMGDNVNLAARMESAAKSWGVYTMIAEETRKQARAHGDDRVVFRPLGRIQVMGREQAVPIYEIVGLKESVSPTAHECIGIFSQGLEKLYARDWDGAIALFEESKRLEPNQPGTLGIKTNPSYVRIEHAEDYKLRPPPKDWDGRYVMESK